MEGLGLDPETVTLLNAFFGFSGMIAWMLFIPWFFFGDHNHR